MTQLAGEEKGSKHLTFKYEGDLEILKCLDASGFSCAGAQECRPLLKWWTQNAHTIVGVTGEAGD